MKTVKFMKKLCSCSKILSFLDPNKQYFRLEYGTRLKSQSAKKSGEKPFLSNELLKDIGESSSTFSHGNKVTVVGVGAVGLACVFSILSQKISYDVAIVDMNKDRLLGEMLDLQHGSFFLKGAHIQASTDYAVTEKSEVCIITAGVRQNPGESRLDLTKRNAEVMDKIVPKLLQYSPDCVILVATNPVDVLTHYVWSISKLPINRVFGSGTNLDSSRFRFLLAQHFDAAPVNMHGWIIGEHGDSSVVAWSGVNISGVRLVDIDPDFGTENENPIYENIHSEVKKSASKVIRLKGYTSWAIGLSIAEITEAILRNSKRVVGVSTLVTGVHEIEDKVFLSLPCMVNSKGVKSIVIQHLSDCEKEELRNSANIIKEAGEEIGL